MKRGPDLVKGKKTRSESFLEALTVEVICEEQVAVNQAETGKRQYGYEERHGVEQTEHGRWREFRKKIVAARAGNIEADRRGVGDVGRGSTLQVLKAMFRSTSHNSLLLSRYSWRALFCALGSVLHLSHVEL